MQNKNHFYRNKKSTKNQQNIIIKNNIRYLYFKFCGELKYYEKIQYKFERRGNK